MKAKWNYTQEVSRQVCGTFMCLILFLLLKYTVLILYAFQILLSPPLKAPTPGCPLLCFPRGTMTYLVWYLYIYISSFLKSIFLFIITNVCISCKVLYSYPLPLSKPNLKRYDSQVQCGLLHFRIRSSALQKVCLRTAAKGRSWWSSG